MGYIISVLLAASAASAHALAIGDQVTLALEASWGASAAFAPRCALAFTAALGATGAPLWKPNATTAGVVTELDQQQLTSLREAGGSGYYRIRARHPSGAWVVGSVRLVRCCASLCLSLSLPPSFARLPHRPPPPSFPPPRCPAQCVLAAADWVHDVVFTLDAAGGPRNIEVRPAVAPGFAGCAAAAAPAPARALPPAGSPWKTRFGVVAYEDAASPPEGAFRGAPYAGQKEVSAAEALATKLSQSGGKADEATKAALAEAAAREAAEAEGRKSWLEKLQPYMMPVMLFLLVQRLFGGDEKEKKAGAAAAAAAARLGLRSAAGKNGGVKSRGFMLYL